MNASTCSTPLHYYQVHQIQKKYFNHLAINVEKHFAKNMTCKSRLPEFFFSFTLNLDHYIKQDSLNKLVYCIGNFLSDFHT
jgi:hypothetical protein